jgi:hypothetical protein
VNDNQRQLINSIQMKLEDVLTDIQVSALFLDSDRKKELKDYVLNDLDHLRIFLTEDYLSIGVE